MKARTVNSASVSRVRDVAISQPPVAPSAFHLLAKPTGAVCNLDCSYCFFLSKEMLYPGSRFRMADELLETYVRQLIEAHSRVPVVEVAWQGGEPTLMGLDFFRRSVELVDHYLKPGQQAAYTIQTNGTKLDDEWAAFLRQHDFLVGISIDGPRELHDTFRVTKGGRGSFDQVMRGLGSLRAAGVEFNVLTTVHAANEHRGGEVYRFLRDECGARFMQFIPVIERTAGSWRDRRGAVVVVARPAALRPGRRSGHQSLGVGGRLRPVPDRRVRGMGPTRRRRGLRADVRRDAGELRRRAAGHVRALRDVRPRARDGAQRRRVLMRPLRRTGATCSATSPSTT